MFNQNKHRLEAQSRLRRICDLTTPNLPLVDDQRADIRSNRCIPVLLIPWENRELIVEDSATALTKDISDSGFSVTLPGPFRGEHVAVGFYLPDVCDRPMFFVGETRNPAPIGGGFWGLGIGNVRMLKDSDAEPLYELTIKRLEKPKAAADVVSEPETGSREGSYVR